MDERERHAWFEGVYADTHRQMSLALLRILRLYPILRDVGNEILEDTYVELFRNSEKLREHPNIRAWLTKTLKYKACDRLREKQREYRRFVPWVEETERVLYVETSPEGDYLRSESLERLRRAIASRVGARSLAILEARYVEKVPVKELAARLGMSPAALKMQIFRWKKKLAKERWEM